MTIIQLILFALLLQVIHFLGTWKLYISAGYKSWQAAVPVYNAVILMKIIGRPKWWVILLFIPTINIILFGVIWIETLRSFGKNSSLDTAFGILTFGLYTYTINYNENVQYQADRSLVPRTWFGEWISALIFAS